MSKSRFCYSPVGFMPWQCLSHMLEVQLPLSIPKQGSRKIKLLGGQT